MLQELWGLLSSPRPTHSGFSQAELRQINEALSHLVLESSAIVRATVVTVDGLARGSFPPQAAEDRISAMSAAMLSLGERICGELGSGEMRYVIVAGAKTLQLLIVLSEDYVLELELRPNVSVDAVLNTIKESTGPLLQALRIETRTL
jgi:predicted regulator of Ras-like GTPase activity (Roadblock/LC7/MglB family)